MPELAFSQGGWRISRLSPYWFRNDLRFHHDGRIKGRLAPCNIERKLGVINDAPIATVRAKVMIRAHEDALNRARINAQRAEHALGIVDHETIDAEPLTDRISLFMDVDAVNRAGLGTLITPDAGGQVKAVEATITWRNGHRQFRIFKLFGKRASAIGIKEIAQRNEHSLAVVITA